MLTLYKLAIPAVLLTGILACSREVELPPVQPLQADRAALQALPGALPGPHKVASKMGLVLPTGDSQRELDVNIYYPANGTQFPLILFSHGNWSDKDSYNRLLEHWASHGYTVVATNHLDCCGAPRGIFNSLRYGKVGLVQERVRDLSSLLAAIPALEQIHPDFAGKSDTDRLALAGHSFGAFSAQQFGGARVYDPDQETYLPAPQLPVKAVVALSPPGPMFGTITADSWLGLATPTLVTTGTWDIQPGFFDDWRLHLMSWETALPGDKYALVTEGADHFLGNLICRLKRESPPQEDALQVIKIASTSFLDAFVKKRREAREFIDSNRLDTVTEGFSHLSQR